MGKLYKNLIQNSDLYDIISANPYIAYDHLNDIDLRQGALPDESIYARLRMEKPALIARLLN